jgi:hypothetical protein
MNVDQKVLHFEYTIKKLIEWYVSLGKDEVTNNFSVLKSLKLLFFVSAARAEPLKKSILLEDVFDEYYAMPYGHVESSIYHDIKTKNGILNYYKIDNAKTIKLINSNEAIFDNLDPDIKDEIDASINYLKSRNSQLVKWPPFDLVNLSHAWYSWQKYYHMAKEYGVQSNKIPYNIIKNEDKIFNLNPF